VGKLSLPPSLPPSFPSLFPFLPLAGIFESKYKEPLLSVFWQTLHTQLAQAVLEGGREGGREGGGGDPVVVMGKACVDVVALGEEGEGEEEVGGEGGRVLLMFDDGSRVKAQCVLAADGVHSGREGGREG